VADILKLKNELLPSEVLEKLKKVTKPIKQTLISPMKFLEEIIGYISVNISKESEESFSNEDMKVVDSFAEIASAFYVDRKYLKVHEELQNRLIFVMVIPKSRLSLLNLSVSVIEVGKQALQELPALASLLVPRDVNRKMDKRAIRS